MIQNGKGIDVFCWYEARLSVNQQAKIWKHSKGCYDSAPLGKADGF